MKYLFIGGSWDGQRRTLIGRPSELLTVIVMRDEHAVPLVANDFWTVPPTADRDYEDYHRRILQVAGVEFIVYTHGWMDTALVFQCLLDGYKVVENKA